MRKEYVLKTAIEQELSEFFARHPRPDYVTFSGSGEPTLNSGIGEVLNWIKSRDASIPVAVLTNGTLLSRQDVVEDIVNADLVLPSLDAATDRVFRLINRPHPELRVDTIIKGLTEFRRRYRGQIWLEVLIVPGLNDREGELNALKSAIENIEPDCIQLNTLDRPGTVPGIRAATREELKQILEFWQLENAEIIAGAEERKQTGAFRRDVESAILETIVRRPCTLDDLTQILGLHKNEVNKYLDVLQTEGKIEPVRQDRGIFYQTVKRASG
jgi:wyosine [tRNA(Phe)-imidazoG37] synthetase (radical SAM superfamily)